MKRSFIIAGGGLLGIFLTIALVESGAAAIRGRQSTAATTGFALETPDLTEVPDLGGEGFTSEGMASDGMASDGVGTGENADGGAQAGPEIPLKRKRSNRKTSRSAISRPHRFMKTRFPAAAKPA